MSAIGRVKAQLLLQDKAEIKNNDLNGKGEVINEEIEGKDNFDDLDYVSNIKLVNIKLRILTSQVFLFILLSIMRRLFTFV